MRFHSFFNWSSKWKRELATLLMALCAMVSMCACEAIDISGITTPADSANVEKESSGHYTGNGSAWCSKLFENPSTLYNNQLALVAAEMSDKAEDKTGNGIKALFSKYGIRNCETYNYTKSSAFAIGHDILYINGEDTTVLVIAARGTQTVAESIGDLFKGPPINKTNDFLDMTVWNNVYDFEEQIWKGINHYLQKYPTLTDTANLKILVTGHSLGGAAASMTAARFTYFADWGGWWSDAADKDDIYGYTFGAIKVLTEKDNVTDGYENIHNIYNYYDSFGPNGNQKGTNASSLYSKFGHTELYYYQEQESLLSCNSHLMKNYKEALENKEKSRDYIELACEEIVSVTDVPIKEDTNNTKPIEDSSLESVSVEDETDYTENINSDFVIEGKWKSVGSDGFGQAQPGAIVIFNGEHCNFYSPSDTYALYQEDGELRLDCTDFLFAITVSFTVDIIDQDHIYIYYGSVPTELKRITKTNIIQ